MLKSVQCLSLHMIYNCLQVECTTSLMQPAIWRSTQMLSMHSMQCMGPPKRPLTTTQLCTRTPHRQRSKSTQVWLNSIPTRASPAFAHANLILSASQDV